MSWLGRVRQPEHHVHLPVGSAEVLGESPLWPTLAVLTAAGLYATLPGRFVVELGLGAFGALRWIVPALTVVLIVPLALTVPRNQRFLHAAGAHARRIKLSRRVASPAVIALITRANGISIVLLVHLLVNGAHTQAHLLLKAGIHLWITNVLVFALWFWQLDGGGPIARRLRSRLRPGLPLPAAAARPAGAPLAADVRRLPLPRVHERHRVQPHGRDAADQVGEAADDGAVGREPPARDHGRRPRREHPALAEFRAVRRGL